MNRRYRRIAAGQESEPHASLAVAGSAQPPTPDRRRSLSARGRKAGFGLWVLSAMWIVILFDPQLLLAAHGFTPALKIQVLLLPLLAATMAFGVPTIDAWGRRFQWYFPFLCFIAASMVTIPWVPNLGLARIGLQFFVTFWLLIVATATLVDTARRAELLLFMYGLQFVWWGLWGDRTGYVGWHYTLLANSDAFGSLMVIGAGLCSFLVLAAKRGVFRRVMMGAVALCVVGVVASFARGAALALIGVYAVVWMRSPNKGRTLAAGIGGVLLVVAAASILYPGTFWTEIKSAFTEGASEGTGNDRWELWKAAWKVFLQRPIFGTGPNNWGAFAAGFFQYGEVGSRYANPGTLYNRDLHSSYFQLLSEHGIVGVTIFGWMLWDFWRRNAALRTAAAQERWREIGGRLKLGAVALGLEAALVGQLVIAAVYSQGGKHWLYTILALNVLLHNLAVRSPPLRRRGGRSRGLPRRGRRLAS